MTLKVTVLEASESLYKDIKETNLKFDARSVQGSGSLSDPYCYKITLSNENAQECKGIIHFEYGEEQPTSDAEFFMPAFMYGTNRGDCPQDVADAYPRLRRKDKNPTFPSSTWWKTRGDRLSHPVTIAYANGRMYGISASPYFVKKDSLIRPWYPSETLTDFFQYAGFSCDIQTGTVGYTLGYENAPYFFADAHNYYQQEITDSNYFCLEGNTSVTFEMKVYDFKNAKKADVTSIIRNVYEIYHQQPREGAQIKDAVEKISKAISENAYSDKHQNYIGMTYAKGEERSYGEIFSFSWTNGFAVAVPMLLAGIRTGQEQLRQEALQVWARTTSSRSIASNGKYYG